MSPASSTWLADLNPGQLIITANRRLALYWQEQYSLYKQSLGERIWQPLDILPWQSWLVRCYQQGLDSGHLLPQLLLNEQQELSIWQDIISQTATPLLQITATAREARRAWQLLWEWQCSLDHACFKETEDSAAFQTWAQQFQQHLARKQWLDCSRLPEVIYDLLTHHPEQIPKQVHWLGFVEFTPQQQKLMAQINVSGDVYQPTNPAPQVIQSLTNPNQATEMRTMARWAKQLAEHPSHRIGCIVSNLASMRSELLRTFTEVFAPELLLEPTPIETRLPFNIAAGLKLIDYPLVHAALQALQLNQAYISCRNLDYLLRAPFFGLTEQWSLHTRLQKLLRPYSNHKLSHKQLRAWIQSQSLKCQWLDNVALLLDNIACQENQLSPSQWAQCFSKQLALLGWPGDRTLASEEYQLLQKWQELLASFASLDLIYPHLSSGQALAKLQSLAMTTLFQPQTAGCNVQVLDPLDAVGQAFTHLWIMQMDDRHWPSQASPNSLLPISLQRMRLMPHASSKRETDYCSKLLAHYYASSSHIILSFAQQEADSALRPSRLLAGINQISHADLALAPDIQLAKVMASGIQLTEIELRPAPPVSESEYVRGGAGLLKTQAACAFKAFAEYRLGAHTVENWELGLAATEKGNLLHACLEYMWGRLLSKQQLEKLSEQECLQLVQQAITHAKAQQNPARLETLNSKLWQLETLRLTKLLLNWLALEKQRPDFTVVATEQTTEINLAGLALRLKIDRIDQLSTGEYLIIDYKTSRVQVQWQAENLSEPQLPLYCLSSPYPVAAVSLAQVRNDEMKFHGLAQKEGLLPEVKTADDWQAVLLNWQAMLQQLGKQFLRGEASIAPRDKQTCGLCKLELVCRISSTAITQLAES